MVRKRLYLEPLKNLENTALIHPRIQSPENQSIISHHTNSVGTQEGLGETPTSRPNNRGSMCFKSRFCKKLFIKSPVCKKNFGFRECDCFERL
jgi:hypothetical protein